VVRKVVRRVVRRVIRKVITTRTSSRTSLLMRRLTSLDHGSRCFRGEEPAARPPANEGDITSEAGPDPSLPTTWLRTDKGIHVNQGGAWCSQDIVDDRGD